jgi:hypothetical protein
MKFDKVNENWQTVFAIIPFVNLWAAYRIKKLRMFLFIEILFTVLGVVVQLFIPPPFAFIVYGIPITIITMIILRKWSIKWNEKISFDIDSNRTRTI